MDNDSKNEQELRVILQKERLVSFRNSIMRYLDGVCASGIPESIKNEVNVIIEKHCKAMDDGYASASVHFNSAIKEISELIKDRG